MEGEELRYIEYDYIGEVHPAFFIHFYKLGIHRMCANARTESENTLALHIDVALYVAGYLIGKECSALVYILENACIDFLFAAKCCSFYFRIGIIVALGYSVQFYLAT